MTLLFRKHSQLFSCKHACFSIWELKGSHNNWQALQNFSPEVQWKQVKQSQIIKTQHEIKSGGELPIITCTWWVTYLNFFNALYKLFLSDNSQRGGGGNGLSRITEGHPSFYISRYFQYQLLCDSKDKKPCLLKLLRLTKYNCFHPHVLKLNDNSLSTSVFRYE